MKSPCALLCRCTATASLLVCSSLLLHAQESAPLLTGKAAMGDWTADAPGVRRKISLEDLPDPSKSNASPSKGIPRPEGAWPKAPEGFQVEEFARGFNEPRIVVTAPNGDLFVAESKANRISVLRDADGDGKPEIREVFMIGLNKPFGIAFYPPGPEPQFIYIGSTDAVVRVPYKNGQLKATARQEKIFEVSGGGQLTGGGHWTRDIVFSVEGRKLFVSVGSKSNVSDDPVERSRARIFELDPDGKNPRTFAWGLRNPVGLAMHQSTGLLWTTVNERDDLGDDLVPDYVTVVQDGGFYGWPWFYMGPRQDPRHEGKHPELKDQVINPDVLLQAHSAALGITFYTTGNFPPEYQGNAFVALHGSWNRAQRTGYKVVRIPTQPNGRPQGEYVDFLTGFVTPQGAVWGRPVGVAVAKDGALIVSDDGGNCLWRVTYTGKK
jgi:glucose/arabinose dehydrogenase